MGATVVKYLEKMQLIWAGGGGGKKTGKFSLDFSWEENNREKAKKARAQKNFFFAK